MNTTTELKKISNTHIKIQKLSRKIKVYLAYFKIKFLNEIQYKIAAIAGIITQFAWAGMYIMLYATFLKNGTSGDYTISQMSSYIWLQQAFYMMFNMWSVDKEILEQCKTGNISMELVRPIDIYSIWHAKTLGRKTALVVLRAIPIILICTLPIFGQYGLSGPVSLSALVFFIVTLILSIGIMMSYLMLMYVCVMKTVSDQGIKVAFQMLIEACSGALIPIAFMPDIVVKILKFTPFYYMQNAAFNIYNGYITNIKEIIVIICVQFLWLIILTAIGKRITRKQLRKIIVQGG